VVVDRALDALLDRIEKRRFGRATRPRAARASRAKRYIPSEERRRAVARDGLRCSFVSADGRRCEETGFLEFDHVVPVALGGQASDGVRVLCRSHNQHEAERILGRGAWGDGDRRPEVEAGGRPPGRSAPRPRALLSRRGTAQKE
jgi:hypothetical protein